VTFHVTNDSVLSHSWREDSFIAGNHWDGQDSGWVLRGGVVLPASNRDRTCGTEHWAMCDCTHAFLQMWVARHALRHLQSSVAHCSQADRAERLSQLRK